MDEIDKRQQEQIDDLHSKAEKNRNTDNAQWGAIIVAVAVLALYLNLVLLSVINQQQHTLNAVIMKCGK